MGFGVEFGGGEFVVDVYLELGGKGKMSYGALFRTNRICNIEAPM